MSLHEGPYYVGSILGALIFGNSHMTRPCLEALPEGPSTQYETSDSENHTLNGVWNQKPKSSGTWTF